MSEGKVYRKEVLHIMAPSFGVNLSYDQTIPSRSQRILKFHFNGEPIIFRSLPVGGAIREDSVCGSFVSIRDVGGDTVNISAEINAGDGVYVLAYSTIPTFTLDRWTEVNAGPSGMVPNEELCRKYKAFLKKGYFV